MCGICGKINLNGERVEENVIKRMTEALHHRGPDDEGVYIDAPAFSRSPVSAGLGHKRLSIIDLSPKGRQPMANEDKSVWMVFNGEIYNFQILKLELQSKGHHFTSGTDGEVILHLYEEEGIGGLTKLNGMFAFALWDKKKEALFLARDRLGIKPLVYFWDGKHLSFASELRSLRQDPDVPRDINFEALDLYLTFNYIPAPHTIFHKLYKLKPGHYLHLENEHLNIKQYWSPQKEHGAAEKPAPQFSVYKENLSRVLEDAVKSHLIADVPVGAFLSGGLDSSIITALMAKNSNTAVKTFSIGFEDNKMFDETAYAREVADMHGTEHTDIRLSAGEALDTVQSLLHWFDEPFADSSAVPTFIVSEKTRAHVKVALSGDGGDELFAGYRMYQGESIYKRYRFIPGFIREHFLKPLVRHFPDARDKRFFEQLRRVKKFVLGAESSLEERFFAWNRIFTRDIRERLLKKSVNPDLGRNLTRERLNAFKGEDLNRMLLTDLTLSLPNDMLAKVDWMSMKTSLEVRVPLLDHRVVELACAMPASWKLRKGRGKYILTETFKDLLPPSLLKRPKWGFEIPISQWLKTDLKFLIDEHLDKKKLASQGIFNPEAVESVIRSFQTGKTDTSWQLWNLIVFQAWLDGPWGV